MVIENIAMDNLVYLSIFNLEMKQLGRWNEDEGKNFLDGGAPFYQIYQVKDGRWFVVACIEAKFFKVFVDKLPISGDKKQSLIDS